MKPKQSTLKAELRIVTKKFIYISSCTILLVIYSFFPVAEGADSKAPLIITVQPLGQLSVTSLTATRYLKKLIEHRTDNQIGISLQLSGEQSVKPHNLQMAVLDKQQPEALKQQLNEATRAIGRSGDSHYQLLINHKLWERLSADLKIILLGAIEDTKSYLAELNRNKQHEPSN